MDEKPYHHGDLRNALIEAGISLINEKGIAQFSLRKVALLCGVSHTAPYAHFKDAGALLAAMREHVTTQFMVQLQSAVQGQKQDGTVVTALGKAYIRFFAEHPHYYQFLFYHSNIRVDLDNDDSGGYPPFTLFRQTAYRVFDSVGMPPAAKKQTLIGLWAWVHGIAGLLSNPNFSYTGNWLEIMDGMGNMGITGNGKEG